MTAAATRPQLTWSAVTSANPCPICKHDSWCGRGTDGTFVGTIIACMRVSEGAFNSQQTKAGLAHYHRLVPLPAAQPKRESRPVTAAEATVAADPDTRHKIYTAWLAGLTLSDAHRLDLERRKAPQSFTDYGYKTFPEKPWGDEIDALRKAFSDEAILSVPGFVIATNKDSGQRYIKANGKAGLLIPVRDAQGRITAVKCRRDGASRGGKFRWLTSRTKDNRQGPSPSTPAHCPIGVRGPVAVIRLAEGPLKADIATSLNCLPTIGMDGAATWRPAVDLAIELGASTVRLAFDADAAQKKEVAEELVKCVTEIQARGLAVEIEKWPVEHKGIDDLLAAGGTPTVVPGDAIAGYLQDLLARASSADRDNRPEVEISTDEHETTAAAISGLAGDDSVYQRSGRLVRVIAGADSSDGIRRHSEAPRITTIPTAVVRSLLTRACRFVKVKLTEDGEQRIASHPPNWMVNAVAEWGHWPGIRYLAGIVNSPVLRPDGTILNAPGYDEATGLLFDPQGLTFDIPDRPTLEDSRRAAASLLDVVCDFPFEKPSHRSAWLTFVLTAPARHAFDGPAPLFVADANTAGSGKTLIMEVGAIINTGRDFARMSNPADDDECRKRILSVALAGDPLVLIDNVDGVLGCASLDAALTATVWKDRLLGRSEMVEIPLSAVWAASGNNVILGADTSRRAVHIRLNAPCERPEEREHFKRPYLRQWVKDNRPALLSAALTILRAYCLAGRPAQHLKPWGSFEGWSDLVRQAVVWIGEPDPGDTREELAASSNHHAGTIRALIDFWPPGDDRTASELLKLIDETESYDSASGFSGEHFKYERFREAVIEFCDSKNGKLPGARVLGNRLKKIRGKVVGKNSINCKPNRDDVMVWFVQPVDKSAGSAGSAGSTSYPLHTRGEEIDVNENINIEGTGTDPAEPADPAAMVARYGDWVSVSPA